MVFSYIVILDSVYVSVGLSSCIVTVSEPVHVTVTIIFVTPVLTVKS